MYNLLLKDLHRCIAFEDFDPGRAHEYCMRLRCLAAGPANNYAGGYGRKLVIAVTSTWLALASFQTIALADDDCNLGQSGPDCSPYSNGQRQSFDDASGNYVDAATATEDLEVATKLLNLGIAAAGLASNMNSINNGPVSRTYGQGAPAQVPRHRNSDITGLGR